MRCWCLEERDGMPIGFGQQDVFGKILIKCTGSFCSGLLKILPASAFSGARIQEASFSRGPSECLRDSLSSSSIELPSNYSIMWSVHVNQRSNFEVPNMPHYLHILSTIIDIKVPRLLIFQVLFAPARRCLRPGVPDGQGRPGPTSWECPRCRNPSSALRRVTCSVSRAWRLPKMVDTPKYPITGWLILWRILFSV